MPYDLHDAVYPVENEIYSMHELLESFTDPSLEVDGLSRVSDFHFKAGEPLYYRLDEELEKYPGGATLTEEAIERLLFPMLNEAQQRQIKEERRDIDTGFHWVEGAANFRINAFYDRDGLAFALRLLPRQVPDIAELGLPNEAVWRDIVNLKQGLVLVTGITGSGKTTTIASLIDHINRNRRGRIITLEDPIEYVHRSRRCLISQRELGTDMPSLSGGLRSAVRENPDIVVVGEMRDLETTTLALSAAETGHLVFSSLHTRDARGALSRIIDMVPSTRSNEIAAQLSFGLRYVISQKLVPRLDGRGRLIAAEVLNNIPSMGNLIRSSNWSQIYSLMETRHRDGMNTLEQHLIELCENGHISREDAIAYANDPVIEERLKV